MIGATIIARNYRAHARVLESSFLEHHPGATFVTLIIDGGEEDVVAGASPAAILPEELGLPDREWKQMAGVYTVMELATAIKPALLRYMVTRDLAAGGRGAAMYLDPDIKIYQPFPEIYELAARTGIVLTPHVLHPVPRDGRLPSETDLMQAGIFNLGFICVGEGSEPFLNWWHDRLMVDAVVDFTNSLFTDQRWVDWVPALWGAEVTRDHGLNVAYWNLHERELTLADDGSVLAGGDPLRFFHFSAYDPKFPWRLSRHVARNPRCTLGDDAVLADLCADYADSLVACGYNADERPTYGFDVAPNGMRLTPRVRAAYRTGLKQSGVTGPGPPSPFGDDGGNGFAEWLLSSMLGPSRLGMGRWHQQLWRERPDLQVAFPDPGGLDAYRFRAWLDSDPRAVAEYEELNVPAAFANAPDSTPRRPTPAEGDACKWNVVGYFSAELGVGEAARRMRLAFDYAGIGTHLVSVGVGTSRSEHRTRFAITDELRYANSLYCVNADQLLRTVAMTSTAEAQAHLDRHSGARIGLWFWEVSELPDYGAATYSLLDEIWVASQFVADAVTPASPIPVRVVPLPVLVAKEPMPYTREQLGMPDGFVFFFSYDFNSILERKNPLGAIDAYRRAFGPDEGAKLVLKSINGDTHADQLARVRFAARDRPDIVVVDGYVSSYETQAMIERSDCLLSLHRSEGFGLNLAAAMAAGRPVIATGYSGNMAFMDDDSALLVPYELVPVGEGNDPYPPAAQWAEPDLDAAAAQMRQVFDRPALAKQVGERGRQRVIRSHGLETAGAEIARLLGLPQTQLEAAA